MLQICEKKGYNTNFDLANINLYIKFGEIISICSQDIEQKRIFDINQGHSSVTIMRKNDR